jgi:hypothetical protein
MPLFGLARASEVESEIEKLNNNVSDKIETLDNNVNNIMKRVNYLMDTKIGNIALENEQPSSSSMCYQAPGIEYTMAFCTDNDLPPSISFLKKEDAVSADSLDLENKCWLVSDYENKVWVCADYPERRSALFSYLMSGGR